MAENSYTQNEYFGISNCIFNFNFLDLVVSEILGGSQIYIRRLCASEGTLVEKFCHTHKYLPISV